MEALLKLLPGPQPLLVRYGITVLIVALMFAVKLGMQNATGLYGFIVYVPAVVAAALVFDRGSGYLAVVVSAAFVASSVPWTAERTNDHLSAIASFIIVGSGLVFISEGLHRALERAENAARERDLLLEEMSHRVKNKFTLINSIIGLQCKDAAPEVKAALDAVAGRVRIIANVHDYLQISRHQGLVGMSGYLTKLCGALAAAGAHMRPIILAVDAVNVEFPPQKALSIGLIVNELVTNAFKYAFPDDRAGTIRIQLRRVDGIFELAVSDDGIGASGEPHSGLGTRLINVLAAQIGGSVRREIPDTGYCVIVSFQGDIV